MGLDGGTYITRSDILRGQSWDFNTNENSRSTRGGSVQGVYKKRKLDRQSDRHTKWSTCTLSEQPLQPPIVADFLGNLYNREAVLEFLLGKAGHFADVDAEHRFLNQLRTAEGELAHLGGKRDVFDLDVTPGLQAQASSAVASNGLETYKCPITDLPCLTHPFSALSKCGHLFSQRAVNQVTYHYKDPVGLDPENEQHYLMTEQSCSICSRPFNENFVIPINGSPEQKRQLQEKLKDRKQSEHRKKEKRKAVVGQANLVQQKEIDKMKLSHHESIV